jgi:hypothetical protein
MSSVQMTSIVLDAKLNSANCASCRNDGVVMSGTFQKDLDPKAVLNRAGRWHKPWFYKHVEQESITTACALYD